MVDTLPGLRATHLENRQSPNSRLNSALCVHVGPRGSRDVREDFYLSLKVLCCPVLTEKGAGQTNHIQ